MYFLIFIYISLLFVIKFTQIIYNNIDTGKTQLKLNSFNFINIF